MNLNANLGKNQHRPCENQRRFSNHDSTFRLEQVAGDGVAGGDFLHLRLLHAWVNLNKT